MCPSFLSKSIIFCACVGAVVLLGFKGVGGGGGGGATEAEVFPNPNEPPVVVSNFIIIFLDMIWRRRRRNKYFNRTIFIQTFHKHAGGGGGRPPIDPPPPPPPPPQLTPQLVQSTLINSPSDLISLSFFFWCARQNQYFHSRPAFHHMVSVLSRLTLRFGSVQHILLQLNTLGGFLIKPQLLLLLLRIYWHGHMYDAVCQTFELMLHHGYTPDTYARNIIMDVFFKIGRVSVALTVLKDTPAPNFFTFSIAISNLCRVGDFTNLLPVLRNMFRNGYYPNIDTFSVVLSSFCKMGRLTEALQLYGIMVTLGIPLSVKTWSILIHGFSKSGNLVMAAYLFDKMVASGYSPNVVTCTSLVKGFMESQMPDIAFTLLRTLESKGNSLDLVLCNVLINCLAKMGRHDDALHLFVSLSKRKLIPDSYTFCSIITMVCLSRQFTLLPALIRGLPVQADLVMCNSILSYYCKAGYPSRAVEFYNDMIDRGMLPDRYSFAGLLRGLCGAGRINEAVNVYRGIVMNHVGLDAHVHTAILDGLIRSGDFHRAVRLFSEAAAKKYPLDVASYTVAINGLFRAGRSEEAYKLYCLMKEEDIAPNGKTYNVMLTGFCRQRDVNKVEQILQEMLEARIELDCNALNRIKSLLLKLHRYHSIISLFFKFQDCGLVPGKAVSDLIDELAHVVDAANPYLPLGDGDMVDHLDSRETSSSEELLDVAASVG